MAEYMINFAIKTFGCKVNHYNSQLLLEYLLSSGFYINYADQFIDLLIVNSCVVTKNAEKEVLRFCKKKIADKRKLIVYGCASSELKEDLNKIGILFESYDEMIKILIPDKTQKTNPISQISGFQDRTRVFVKVQSGCNQYCSYCIVPIVRGSFESRSRYEIISEVKKIVEAGYKEIVLTGTQIGLYQDICSQNSSLLDLMIELENTFHKDLFRIRISSIGPTFISKEMISFLHSSTLFCNHMHISLQSGSNDILKKMNRKYTAESYYDLTDQLKKAKQGFCISTDIIVGFPGETEEDFNKTINLCKKIQFSKIHVFPFSPRLGTVAYHFDSKFLPGVVKKRTIDLLELSKTLSYNVKQEFIGKNVEVLVEEDSSGYTTNYLRVVLQNRDNRKGQLASVSVGSCDAEALYESNLT
jgi:threonylcarbamoyladenosine tRNA methylthiotransferase MtaB